MGVLGGGEMGILLESWGDVVSSLFCSSEICTDV